MKLQGKKALVTGGAQGLGFAIATEFSRQGANVIIVDLNAERASAAASEIGVHAIVADLAEPSRRAEVVAETSHRLGGLDVLVNCHGICLTRPMMEVTEEEWRRTFEINTASTFFLIKEAASLMMHQEAGSIVNLASNSAFLPKPEQADYAASKAAIVSLTRSAAASLGPYGIRVNAIAPGVIPTPMTQGIAEARAEQRGATVEEMFKMFEPLTALKRLGTPEEVAKAAAFLASDEASYITGQTLEVCGGLVMR